MSHEFACHSKACAPPPAGKGGSDNRGNDITKDVYHDTMKWKSKPGYQFSDHKVHVASDPNYEIHMRKGILGTSYGAHFKGERFTSQSSMHVAKAAVEIHKAGHWKMPGGLKFWNVPPKPVRKR